MTHRRSEGQLGQARGYHPRGRTVRDRQGARDAAGRNADPFRSALQVFDEDQPRSRGDGRAGQSAGTAGREASGAGTGAPAASRRRGRDEGRQRTTGASAGASGGGAAGAGGSGGRKAGGTRTPRRTAGGNRGGGRPPRRPRRGGSSGLASPMRRLRLATALAMTLFSVIGLRLVEMQVTDGPAFAASGREDRLQTVTLPAARGAIYDRGGEVLADSVEARYVYADPVLVEDPTATARELQPLLGIPASQLHPHLVPTVRDDGVVDRFVMVARGVDLATAERIEELTLPGIGTDLDERRIVPNNDLAANLIGFTGEDQSGLEGLEASYDEVLRGIDGERTYETGGGVTEGQAIPAGYQAETPPRPGSDLRLTVDMDLQYRVQQVLAETLRRQGAELGAAVVLDARAGEVLAQASYPTYNAADPTSVPPEDRRDVATATVYDPGSAHKPLVFGAALEEGVIAPGDSLTVDPSVRKGDETFVDTHPHPPDTELTLPAMMALSSNVGTITIADTLGSHRLHEYQQAFGLGEATGVGMPGEADGALLHPDDWYGSSHGSVPIGHSVDVTAVQLAAAYGAIANDGVWVQPRLVQAVVPPDGPERAADDPDSRRVLSEQNAAYLRELLEAVVVVPEATGTAAAVEGYRVGGKTGTGKMVVDGEYAPGDVATFVGMAPIDHPRYVVAVTAYLPDGGGTDGVASVFREVTDYTLSHYRVPPATSEPPTFTLYP